jgi:large subunit ribosomal protein L9
MIELILMQRVEKLGQMGEVVKVKPGYARNFLLPQGKAIRATKENCERFERERAQLEAQNLKRREEAERVAERVAGLAVVLIRTAGESGSLYGSVTARDIATACKEAGLTVDRQQVLLEHPIKALGLTTVRVQLHPEVTIPVTVNVARSPEEAERQARGEAGAAPEEAGEEESLEAQLAAEMPEEGSSAARGG